MLQIPHCGIFNTGTVEDYEKRHSRSSHRLRSLASDCLRCVSKCVSRTTSQHTHFFVLIFSSLKHVLMDQAPAIEQVIKVYIPTPISAVETPILGEVRWTSNLPFGNNDGSGLYFVRRKVVF